MVVLRTLDHVPVFVTSDVHRQWVVDLDAQVLENFLTGVKLVLLIAND